MQINAGARPATITLKTTAEATQTGTDQQLPVVLSSEAIVEVIAEGSEPAVSCFFFAH
jgi:hypothetical protein